jgi:NAD(P)-dependent dehydrogenase (short-subunit alcohol dehydrogenase family)
MTEWFNSNSNRSKSMGKEEVELEPWHKLDDKVVLVTGASSGLGYDFCLDLAKAGCRIVAAARRLDRLHSLCHQINHLYGNGNLNLRAVAVELDVSADGVAIDKSVQKAWDAFGHIDTLINNAGVRGSVKSPLDLSEDEWNHVFKTNLTGSWLVSKYVCKRMCDAHIKGSVINISSTSGLNRGNLSGAVAYASSKAGLNMLTKVIVFLYISSYFFCLQLCNLVLVLDESYHYIVHITKIKVEFSLAVCYD